MKHVNASSFCFFGFFIVSSVGFDPFSTMSITEAVSALGGMLYNSYNNISCSLVECCDNHWIPNDLTQLKKLLSDEVFGQHLATSLVYNQIAAHVSQDRQPAKALVMSLHGWTGSGKNHIANLTAHSLYRKGMKSKFVHHFMAEVHFPYFRDKHTYQDQLRDWVKWNISSCPQSLFIFDEVERMPPGMLDGIKSYLDYHDNVDGVDYRRSIFIFLSNSGSAEITKKTLKIWKDGKLKREQLTYKDFETVLLQEAFNEKGGLFQSNLIDRSLIDVSVPFLPLEQQHVKLCAEREFKRMGRESSLEDLRNIADAMVYYPDDIKIYSTTGCKRVAALVGRYLADLKLGDLFI